MIGSGMRGDNAKLRETDKAMGWVEPDGSSPATTAERLGVASHIIEISMGLPVVVWESGGVFSYCVLNRYRFFTNTVLARSKGGVLRLLNQLYKRVHDEDSAKRWQSYYSDMWERRYRRWVHKKADCNCQLCRMGR